jgi:hypothetical protein
MATADTVQVNPDHPERYVVQKGDTLWDIAGRFLTEPWRWPEIWKVNPQIENPHLIYPGDVVSLTYVDGSPVLTAERRAAGSRDVRLSPTVRAYERDDAVPSIPIDAIRHFLMRPLVVEDAEMDSWPYIVSSYDQHLVAGASDRIYVRGMSAVSDQRRYSIYRKGPAYRSDGGKGTILGYEAIYVGEAFVESFGDPATAVVTQSSREVLNGDRLVPVSEREITSDFIPRPPGSRVQGSIISVIDGLSEIGQYQVVVLDVGAREGIETGNVLGVYQSGKVVTDRVGQKPAHEFIEYLGRPKSGDRTVQLPEEYAGVVMVFRTFPQISYALVMETRGPLKLYDAVRNL